MTFSVFIQKTENRQKSTSWLKKLITEKTELLKKLKTCYFLKKPSLEFYKEQKLYKQTFEDLKFKQYFFKSFTTPLERMANI